MLRFLLRLAGFIVVVVIIRHLLGWLFSSLAGNPHSAVQKQTVAGEARRDPVCGMFVATELSVRAVVDGKEEHFCSAQCRDKWVAERRLQIAG